MTFLYKNKPVTEPRDATDMDERPQGSPGHRRSGRRLPLNQRATGLWIDKHRNHQSQPVEVLNHSIGGIGLRSFLPLETGQTMSLQMGAGIFVEGVVRFCEPDADAYRAGLMLNERKDRRLERESTSIRGAVHWAERPHCGVTLPVTIRNINESGLQLEAHRAVPLPVNVRVCSQDFEYQGVTRYCREADGRYLVGIELAHLPYDQGVREQKEH